MDIALREGDTDAGRAELVVDGLVQFAGDSEAVVQALQVAAQHESQRIVVKALEIDQRRRIGEYTRILRGGLAEQLQGLARVAAVFGADRDDDAIDLIGQGPVEQPAGDELFVRYEQFLLVPVTNGGSADLDPGDDARGVADGDDVADSYRTLEQDDQAADEVGDDLLQAEADANAECRDEPLHLTPGQAEGAEHEQGADGRDGVAGQRNDGVAAAGADGGIFQQQDLQQTGQILAGGERD